MDWHDYGWRNYDAALGRWHGVDNMSEKYISYSPYHYAGNNPVRYFDIDGNEFTQDAWKWVNNLLGEITNRLQKLDRKISRKLKKINSGKGGNGTRKSLAKLQSKKTGLNEARGEIGLLAASDQIYNVVEDASLHTETGSMGNKTTTDGGRTFFNSSTGFVDIRISNKASLGLFAHELKHAYQFEKGEISLRFPEVSAKKIEGYLLFADQYDEAQAEIRGGIFGHRKSAEDYSKLPSGPVDVNHPYYKKALTQYKNINGQESMFWFSRARAHRMAVRVNGKTYY